MSDQALELLSASTPRRSNEAFFSAEHGEQQEWVPCPLCGADDSEVRRTAHDRLFARPGRYHVVRCRRCGLQYTNPRPTFDALGRHYPPDYFCYEPPESFRGARGFFLRSVAERVIERRIELIEGVRGRLEPSTRVCDVGCSYGLLLAGMKQKRGCDVVGVDFNPEMVEHGARRGVQIVPGTLKEARFDAERFDLITMTEYLEHEPQPYEVLGECRRVMKTGGHVVIEVPTIEGRAARWFGNYWSQLDLPRHLIFFTPQSIERMLAENGFEIVHLEQFHGTIGLSLLHILGYEKVGRMSLGDILAILLATIPLTPFLRFLPEFMFVVARAVDRPALPAAVP
jgi:SAM-dependent methyltransferase